MPPRALFLSALTAVAAAFALLIVLPWHPWDFGDPGAGSSDSPAMTLEGVIALVSREHTGCPDQPALALTADATYDGDGQWTVTYRDYTWIVDEADRSVRAIGHPLPCPGR